MKTRLIDKALFVSLFVVSLCITQIGFSQEVQLRPKLNLQLDPYANSEILFERGGHTVVPKGGLIVVPEKLKDKVLSKHSGKFMIWPKFYRSNMAWLHKHEVTVKQALGDVEIEEKTLQGLMSLNKIVVAVYRGNPVSLMPFKGGKEDEK